MREVATVLLLTLLIGSLAACCYAGRAIRCYDVHANACLD